MGKKSKRKGNSGEHEVAKILTRFIYADGTGKCVRTPMSGAWKGMSVMTGDILFLKFDPVSADYELDNGVPLKIEVKRSAKKYSPVLSWLSGDALKPFQWLRQVRENCPSSKIPLVFWRTDFSPWFVLMETMDFSALSEWFGSLPDEATTLRVSSRRSLGLVMMPFKDFLEWADVEVLRRAK